MPNIVQCVAALRALLQAPATTDATAQALGSAVQQMGERCMLDADSAEGPDEGNTPTLVGHLIGLGPELEGLGAAMAAELASLSGGKRAVLLRQQDSALYLLQVLSGAVMCPRFLLPWGAARASLGRGAAAMLRAAAATLAAPRLPAEPPPPRLRAQLRGAATVQLETLSHLQDFCEDADFFYFEGAPVSRALAEHALAATAAEQWVGAVAAVLAGTSAPPVDAPTAQRLARLLTGPHAEPLQQALRRNHGVQRALLAVLLPSLLECVPEGEAQHLRPTFMPTCMHALLHTAPDALAAHLAAPAGLHSLQAASRQLQRLQADGQRLQRREQRVAAAAAAGRQPGGEPPPGPARASAEQTALDALVPVRLFAGLAVCVLRGEAVAVRAAVASRLLAEALPALAWLLRQGSEALPAMKPTTARLAARRLRPGQEEEAWGAASAACCDLSVALQAVAQQAGGLDDSRFEEGAGALLAALQLRALLHGLAAANLEWEQRLEAGVPAEPAINERMAAAAAAAERYCLCLAGQLGQLDAPQGAGPAAVPSTAAGSSAARPERLAEAHAICASLLHLLAGSGGGGVAPGGITGGGDQAAAPSLAPRVLGALYEGALRLWPDVTAGASDSPPPESGIMDALLLAHLAALQVEQRSHPHEACAADELAAGLVCPVGCEALMAFAGGAALVERAVDLGVQAPSSEQMPPRQLLEALRDQERQLSEQGAEVHAALHLRRERAKALRPCASLACPNLAADPRPRSRRCARCLAVRYDCTACQALDWREGGHREACGLIRAAEND